MNHFNFSIINNSPGNNTNPVFNATTNLSDSLHSIIKANVPYLGTPKAPTAKGGGAFPAALKSTTSLRKPPSHKSTNSSEIRKFDGSSTNIAGAKYSTTGDNSVE